MARTLILYKTKYGSTEEYGRWLHEAIDSDLVRYERERQISFAGYDRVILGSPIHKGSVAISKLIVEWWPKLAGKEVVLFLVGATPVEHPVFRECYERSLPQRIKDRITFYPLRGRIDTKGLVLSDRMLMHVAS